MTKKDIIFDSSFLLAIAETPTDWKGDMLESVGGFTPVILGAVRELSLIHISEPTRP